MEAGIELEPYPLAGVVLDADAVAFVAKLERRFRTRRAELLEARRERAAQRANGVHDDLLADSVDVRAGQWTCAPVPQPLLDQRVTLLGSTERSSLAAGLSSGAAVYVADFARHSLTWADRIDGHSNLRDAVHGDLTSGDADGIDIDLTAEATATKLFIAPRSWESDEPGMVVDGQAVSAALFDFGLSVYHNATELLDQGVGPYFFLAEVENHIEARLWNDVCCYVQDLLDIDRGSIRANINVGSLLAAFEMDEILYELREHISGLVSEYDEALDVLVATCHRRGVHALGGRDRNAGAVLDLGCDGATITDPAQLGATLQTAAERLGGRLHQLDEAAGAVRVEDLRDRLGNGDLADLGYGTIA